MRVILTFAAIAAVCIMAFCAAADAIERRWARWDAYQHPPDREDEEVDE